MLAGPPRPWQSFVVGPLASLWHVFVMGPLAIFRLRGRSARWLLAYLALASAILGGAGWAVVAHRGRLLEAAVAYVFPSAWHFTGRKLIERIFEQQARTVVTNALVSASLALVAALLFPITERLSRALELDAELSIAAERPLPIARQIAEELALLVVIVSAQMSIFWLGYSPDPVRQRAAEVASYVVLFCQFSFNFVSPLLQRHGLRYATIAKLLFARPLVLFGFGALFTLPAIFATRTAALHHEWPFGLTVAALEAINVVLIAWGTLAGAWVASRLLDDAFAAELPAASWRVLLHLVVLLVFAANLYAFGVVGVALQRKSQLLKCDYAVDLKSIRVQLPKLDKLFSSGPMNVGVKLDVTITNPTPYDVEIERNRLAVDYQEQSVARASLSPLRVPAGKTQRAHVEFPIVIETAILTKGRELFDWHRWRVTLFLEVSPGFEFPVYLLSP